MGSVAVSCARFKSVKVKDGLKTAPHWAIFTTVVSHHSESRVKITTHFEPVCA